MLLPRFAFALVAIALSSGLASAGDPADYLADGTLKAALNLSHVQLGGFAGRLETEIAIAADGSWTASHGVGGRLQQRKGQLTKQRMVQLATALAGANLAGLPETIGAAKPVKSPRQIADGASTTIKLSFGKQTTTANFADGVEVEEETQQLRRRLFAIEAALRAVTLNSPQVAPQEQ